MSPKLRRLSGTEIIEILRKFGFEVTKQRGSHAKLVRTSSDGERQILTVPVNKTLGIGTIKAIYRQALNYIPEDKLREYFYS